MKILLIILFSSLLLTLSHSAQEVKTENIQPKIDIGWPKDINGLVNHLNLWDKDELDVAERRETYPNRIPSGETNGWITEHKRLLKKLGANVIWNDDKIKYQLISSKME